MNKYRILNMETGETADKEAEFLSQAIEQTGWPKELCNCSILAQNIKTPKSRAKKKPAGAEPSETTNATNPLPPEVVEKARKAAVEDQKAAADAEKAEKQLKKAVDEVDIHQPVSDASQSEKDAYENKKRIEAMAIEAEVMFLRMGQLLYNARENGEWTILRYETFKDYVEDLQLPMTNSYSWATRLSNIYEYLVKNMKLDEKLLAEIGVAKLTRLLPLARKGELTQEVIDAARVLSDLDLREELGHSVSGGDAEEIVVCPRCGNQFNAKKAQHVK